MIFKSEIIGNDIVNASFTHNPQHVCVTNKKGESKIFGGFDGLPDLYRSFTESFNESIDFDTACNFFTPNIQTQIIS